MEPDYWHIGILWEVCIDALAVMHFHLCTLLAPGPQCSLSSDDSHTPHALPTVHTNNGQIWIWLIWTWLKHAEACTDEEDSRVKDGGRGWRWWRETQRGAVKAMSPGPAWTQMSTAWQPETWRPSGEGWSRGGEFRGEEQESGGFKIYEMILAFSCSWLKGQK